MDTSELDFDLPESLIATRPAEPRESARLMVVDRRDPSRPPEHRRVADLPSILGSGDLLVFNRTRVLAARFEGINRDTGGSIEGLWLADEPAGVDGRPRWRVLLRARRFRPGWVMSLSGPDGRASGVTLELLERGEEPGSWLVAVEGDRGQSTPAVLDAVGRTPLPRYIRKAREAAGVEVADDEDRSAYQTSYARGVTAGGPALGSVAAPTAGFHFTPSLLATLRERGVERAEVTLHVGAGTFKPIETDRVEDHRMHREWCSMDPEALDLVFGTPRRRVVAVGSTSTRTVESYAAAAADSAVPGWLETDLMIAPGYRWRRVDALVTNFHLPRSTLLAMVAGAVEGGIERVRGLYEEAVRARYRFFSYGDAMLLL